MGIRHKGTSNGPHSPGTLGHHDDQKEGTSYAPLPIVGQSPSGSHSDAQSPSVPGSPKHEVPVNARLAAGKLVSILMKAEAGCCDIERDSVYGAAIVMPQIARSSGWSRTMTTLVIRSYFFLIVNCVLQGWLLFLFNKEQEVMARYSGMMNLCDFGLHLEQCTEDPSIASCMGPGGTPISAPRLYPWTQWAVRKFVQDSMKAVFPESAEKIDMKVDPGEYGVESMCCRWICCFLFMFQVMKDLRSTLGIGYLVYHTPTRDEPWLSYTEPRWGEKSFVKTVRNFSELDFVTIRIAGMTLKWKIITLLCVGLPKLILWRITAVAGITFLMETASIADCVVNCVALTFILQIDEMLCENVMLPAVSTMLTKLEPFELYDTDWDEQANSEEVLAKHQEDTFESGSWQSWTGSFLCNLIPKKFIYLLALTGLLIAEYYLRKCEVGPAGVWVSRAMQLPKSAALSWWSFIFQPFVEMEMEESPYWTMPHEKG